MNWISFTGETESTICNMTTYTEGKSSLKIAREKIERLLGRY